MSETVFAQIERLLQNKQAQYEILRHAPVFTSAEAAAIRGTSLASGAKALICKADDQFVMIVLPADRRLASKEIRRREGIKSLRFATADEVFELTALTPGSIPPFGSLFGLATWCENDLALNERINFNAGDHAVSVQMPYTEYVRVEAPRLGLFAESITQNPEPAA